MARPPDSAMQAPRAQLRSETTGALHFKGELVIRQSEARNMADDVFQEGYKPSRSSFFNPHQRATTAMLSTPIPYFSVEIKKPSEPKRHPNLLGPLFLQSSCISAAACGTLLGWFLPNSELVGWGASTAWRVERRMTRTMGTWFPPLINPR